MLYLKCVLSTEPWFWEACMMVITVLNSNLEQHFKSKILCITEWSWVLNGAWRLSECSIPPQLVHTRWPPGSLKEGSDWKSLTCLPSHHEHIGEKHWLSSERASWTVSDNTQHLSSICSCCAPGSPKVKGIDWKMPFSNAFLFQLLCVWLAFRVLHLGQPERIPATPSLGLIVCFTSGLVYFSASCINDGHLSSWRGLCCVCPPRTQHWSSPRGVSKRLPHRGTNSSWAKGRKDICTH